MTETPYQTYVLSDAAEQTCVEVVPERGGIITRWQVYGEEILYLDAERFANPALSVRGGIPILFPICGNLPQDTYTVDHQQFHLKQHGFARTLPWQVKAQTSNKLTISLASNAQTLQQYPFEFELEFTYRLEGTTLSIQQQFVNHASVSMPFSIGLHPYFLTPDKTQLSFEIPASQSQDQVTKELISFAGEFDFSADEIDTALSPLAGTSATMSDRSRQLAIALEYDSLYSSLVFWTLKDREFCCLEPWSSPRNALNTGENLVHLDPGSSLTTFVQFRVIQLSNTDH